MRRNAIAVCAVLCALLLACAASANPIALWYVRDTPIGAPNGVWDDQWSGGLATPPAEIVLPEDPGYDPDCGQYEEENSFARIGTGENALRGVFYPSMTGTQVAGTVTAAFCFRQTTPEVAMVSLDLYKSGPFGWQPWEYLCGDMAEVIAQSWPPECVFFVLGEIPEMEMQDESFFFVLSCDGQYTDVVWDCTYWEGWFRLPEDDPFNPVSDLTWSAIKAMYK